jgi:multidrug efflux pump subunit AcrA (membrane-fusion protein)
MFGKDKKPTSWLIGLVGAGVLGTAITAYLAFRGTTSKSDITNLIVEVTSKDIAVQIKANGVVQAVQKINLSPKEAGRIAKLYVDEGDRVEQGQLVAHMEDEQFKAQVNQYKAALAKAQADLALKRAATRSEEISEGKARVATAEANVAEMQAKLNRAAEELKRNQFLAQEGAISQNALGEFLRQERSARANLEAAVARLKEQKESLEKLRNGTRKPSQDDIAYVPITTMAEKLAGRKSPYGIPVDYIEVSAQDKKSIRAAAFQIINLLTQRHGKKDFSVVANKSFQNLVSQITGTLSLTLAAIAGISLLVGGVGIMNIMLVSVTERTQEIGLRKALGATQQAILTQFLIEAVILSVAGGLIGLGVGIGSGMLVAVLTPVKPSVPLAAIALAVGVSGSIGLIFGVIPARQAAKLDPIVALRSA